MIKNGLLNQKVNFSFRAGIHVVKDYKGLINWMNQYINTHWILQDYIDNPLKVENKKIHFRIYVLLIKKQKTIISINIQ